MAGSLQCYDFILKDDKIITIIKTILGTKFRISG